MSWEVDIYGAIEVKLGNVCQALDSASGKIAEVDTFCSEAADESELQDTLLKLWRFGFGPWTVAGFMDRFVFSLLRKGLMCLKWSLFHQHVVEQLRRNGWVCVVF